MSGWIPRMLEFCGSPSSGRVAFIFSVGLSNIVVWLVWLFICIWEMKIVDIPSGVYMTYGIANGVAFAGKGVQSFAERPAAVIESKKCKEK